MADRYVLVVEDDVSLREALAETLDLAGYEVATADGAAAALKHMTQCTPGLVISDVKMEGMNGHELLRRIRADHGEVPVILMTAYGTVNDAVSAMQDGATDYVVKPFEADTLLETISRYMPAGEADADGMIAEDPRTRQLATLAERVAGTEATVMILGESGTGKEVLARFIHARSARRAGPFVAINCAAIPENMLEAVLFGYEKGAFTGAYHAHPGKFEQAQGGTLLLDEISEMDLGLQAKLLRVLQEREVERLGGRKSIQLDVRVLATSNRNMRESVDKGEFREDLFYRLNVFPLHLPPLRERPGDIVRLADALLARNRRADQPQLVLSDAAAQRLMEHGWPGNVRELENVVQRALILCRGEQVEVADLSFETDDAPAPALAEPRGGSRLDHDLQSREQELILEALRSEGSRKAAAARLGISPRTLRYKLARLRESGVDLSSAAGAERA